LVLLTSIVIIPKFESNAIMRKVYISELGTISNEAISSPGIMRVVESYWVIKVAIDCVKFNEYTNIVPLTPLIAG